MHRNRTSQSSGGEGAATPPGSCRPEDTDHAEVRNRGSEAAVPERMMPSSSAVAALRRLEGLPAALAGI